MFLFFLTIWATTILANPFPIDSNDIVSKNLDASESSTLSQDAPIVKTHPDDWPIQQNVLLTGTIPLISSDINCPTDTSTDNINEENSILRRQRPRACASSEPKKNNVISPGDATSNQRQAGEPETSTSTEEKICKDPEQSVHVYCGGETVGDPILIVTNCVSEPTTRIEKGPFYPATDVIAQFCCNRFPNKSPLFMAFQCTAVLPAEHTLGTWSAIRWHTWFSEYQQWRRGTGPRPNN